MTNLLVRLFIKNYENIKDNDVRSRYGMMGGVVGIFCNILLFVIKFVIGTIMNSIAITADSFNNLSDAASSVITFVGFKAANKPSDPEHPFGHGRIEYIAGLIVSFIIILVGVEFVKSSFHKIINPTQIEFDVVSLSILILSILLKVWLSAFNKKLGKKIDSATMIGTAIDARNDVITTSTVVLSIIIAKFTGLAVDGYMGMLVALFIIYSGITIAKDTLNPLLGEVPDPELVKQIEELVLSYKGISGIHDLILHNYGPGRSFASLHAEVPEDADIVMIHEVIDKIERDIADSLGVFAVIHMDPICTNDKKVLEIKNKVNDILQSLDNDLSMHDFRIVDGKKNQNIIFDIVVTHHYTDDKINDLISSVETEIKKINDTFNCVISIDKHYSL